MAGSAVGGDFHIELALAEGQPSPFVSLGDTGRFSHVLLGRLAGPGGRTTRFLCLKMQRDAYRARGAQSANPVDNREIDLMWRRELEQLDRLSGRGAPMVLTTGPHQGVMPAMAFDRRTKSVFPIVCPRTWKALVTCRDDALLRECGLEPWSTTTARYLASATQGESPTFYTWSKDAGSEARSGVRVRRRHDLYVDLASAWAALQDGGRQQVRREHPALAAVLADLSVDDIESRLVPLNYYESWSVAVAVYDVHYDEFCDLAGGAPVEHVLGDAADSGRAIAIEGVRQGLLGEGQWQAVPWTPAERLAEIVDEPVRFRRFALEAVWLKMHAFVQVCRVVRDFHIGSACPHLGLSSDNVMLRYLGGATPAPARWGFEVGLVDLGASHRNVLEGVGADRIGPLCLPATDAVRNFASPWLADSERSSTLAMQAVAVPADVAGARGLRLELSSQRERAEGVRAGDFVRIEPDSPLAGTGEQALVARVERVAKGVVVVVAVLPDALTEGSESASAEPQRFTATATFHRRCGTPCDLFSLGMLLARAMLVHEERDLFAVRELWDHVLDRLDTMVGGSSEPALERVTGALNSLLDGEREAFDCASALWPSSLRKQAQDLLPPAIWREIVLLMARLLTGYPGFSFAAHHGDVSDEAPAAPIEAVLVVAEDLLAALQVEFADAEARNAEIAAASADLAARVSESMVDLGGAE